MSKFIFKVPLASWCYITTGMTPEALGPNRDSSSQKGTPKCSLNFYRTSLSASLPATPHLLLPPRPLVSLCHIMALDTPQFPSTPQESLSKCAHNSAKIIPFHTIPSCPQPPKGITRNKANDKKMWNPMSAISCHPSCSLGSCTRDLSRTHAPEAWGSAGGGLAPGSLELGAQSPAFLGVSCHQQDDFTLFQFQSLIFE